MATMENTDNPSQVSQRCGMAKNQEVSSVSAIADLVSWHTDAMFLVLSCIFFFSLFSKMPQYEPYFSTVLAMAETYDLSMIS